MAIEDNYLLVYKLFEFAVSEFFQSEIKQKISSVQNITCITATNDKKIISVFRVSGVLCSPPQSAVQTR